MMAGMDWDRLAQAIIDRRAELGYRKREAFAAAAELSARLLSDLEHNRRQNYDRVTLASVEKALKWEPGAIQRILQGADPSTVLHPDEIARTIRRDDFVLVWMLTNAALTPADLLRVEMLIRQRREQWEREYLWPAVAARIVELGGVVSWPWDEQRSGDS